MSSPLLPAWPSLPYAAWKDTYATLHRWLQIAGKVRLALSPHLNHYWEATFYVTARGLASSAIPLPGRDRLKIPRAERASPAASRSRASERPPGATQAGSGPATSAGVFEIQFDLLADQVRIATSLGATEILALRPQSVAEFEREFMAALGRLGIAVKIWPMPVEIPHPIRFDQDHTHSSYDAEAVRRWWRILVEVERVFQEFRAGFQGKCSPVHLFWGSLDLVVTRFSGRRAPERPGADAVTRDAYSHEVISAGFWPGSDDFPEPAFYAYAVPQPEGFQQASLRPAEAFYNAPLGEFLLKYDDVRRAPSPAAALLDFLWTSYEAAATLANWDRAALERAAPSRA